MTSGPDCDLDCSAQLWIPTTGDGGHAGHVHLCRNGTEKHSFTQWYYTDRKSYPHHYIFFLLFFAKHRYRTYLLLTNFFCTDFCSFCMVFILPYTFIFPFIYLNIFSFFVPFLTSFPENICKSIKIFKFNC
jgi:hypothetical protein